MKYGYARVSTKGQKINGNSLEDQIKQLDAAGCDEIIKEDYTGTSINRPKFSKLLDELKDGDTLVVTKLDRFARTATDGSKLITDLLQKGISVHVLNMGLLNNSPIGKMMVTVILAFAQFERDMIIERTQAGKAIARTKNGYREGRPPISATRKDHAASLIINQKLSYKEVENITGLSRSTIARAVRKKREKSFAYEKEGYNM